MRFEETDIVIVGGGVAGFTVAVEAFRRGLRARVLRRDADGIAAPLSAAVYQPRALASFANLGIYDPLRTAGAVLERVVFLRKGGSEPLLSLEYADADATFPHALGVPHDAFQAVCLDTFARFTAIQVDQGVELLSLLREKGRVTGAVARGPQGDVSYRAQAVVVTTGQGGAPVRAEAGADLRTLPYAEERASFLLPRPDSFPSEVRIWLGPEISITAHPVSAVSLQVSVVAPGSVLAAAKASPDAWRRMVVAAAPGLDEALKGLPSTEGIQTEACARTTVKSWVGDAVALLGTAALTMSPCGLNGPTQAVTDAAVLLGAISKCKFTGDFSRHALRPYETTRRPAAERTADLAHDLHRAALAQGGIPARAREAAFTRLAAAPDLRQRVLRRIAGFDDALPLTMVERLRLAAVFPG
jgi:2-polyprenyl-6-methoxyphenol hydroxylase-like FAD-dependent oxidoreductase